MDPCRRGRRRRRRRFPRTRGDGPVPGYAESSEWKVSPHTRGWTSLLAAAVSPHTRGWTPAHRRHQRHRAGFPAHAGMDRCRPPPPVPARRFPRTRGDGPGKLLILVFHTKVSPHTRGWTLVDDTLQMTLTGFPAHAGMDPRWPPRRCSSCRFPRTRGDGPLVPRVGRHLYGVSPHTRGWTVHRVADPPAAGGFPAHAGMDPTATPGPISARRFPRTRGDGPRKVAGGSMNTRVSPHTRGWTRSSYRPASSLSGFPAHAGMDPAWLRADDPAYWFPRTRGDGPVP